MIPTGTLKRPFDLRTPREFPLMRGMSYGMLYGGKVMEAPNVPPMQRQSLAQQVLIHRTQESSYISVIKNFGLRPDYPTVKAMSLIRTSPARSRRPLPRMTIRPGGFAQPGAQGYMGAPPRFRKALRSPLNPFNPPVYG